MSDPLTTRVPEPQPSALQRAETSEARDKPLTPGESAIQSRFTSALDNAKAFFATGDNSSLPDGIGTKSAGEVYEANTENTRNNMENAGYYLQEFKTAYLEAKAAGLELDPTETAAINQMANDYAKFTVRMSDSMAQEALNTTKQVASDTELEHAANKANNQAKAWATAASVFSIAASPASFTGGKLEDAANSAVSNARNQYLLDEMKPLAGDGLNTDTDWADTVTAELGGFGEFLDNEGFTEASETVDKANAFGAEVMKRAAQEVFAVGTLADLRANHAFINRDSDGRAFKGMRRGDEVGSADIFAARDLESMGYSVQTTSKADFIAKADDFSNHTYTHKSDANNFFIHNVEDGSGELPAAGLSIWDNKLDVSVNQQLDRIDDRWNTDNHEQQSRDTLEWIAWKMGFEIPRGSF